MLDVERIVDCSMRSTYYTQYGLGVGRVSESSTGHRLIHALLPALLVYLKSITISSPTSYEVLLAHTVIGLESRSQLLSPVSTITVIDAEEALLRRLANDIYESINN